MIVFFSLYIQWYRCLRFYLLAENIHFCFTGVAIEVILSKNCVFRMEFFFGPTSLCDRFEWASNILIMFALNELLQEREENTVSNLDCPIFQYKCSVILLLNFVLLIEVLSQGFCQAPRCLCDRRDLVTVRQV